MFEFEGMIGMVGVCVFMLVVFVLFCVFGSKRDGFQAETKEDAEFVNDFIANTDVQPQVTPAQLKNDFPGFGNHEMPAPQVQPEPSYQATFVPPLPSQGLNNVLENNTLEDEETTVLSKDNLSKAQNQAGSYVSEETMLLSREVLSAVSLGELAPSVDAKKTELDNMVSQIAKASPDILLPEKPLAFGYKMAWLAIPNVKNSQVIKDLNLQNIKPANWTQGLTAAYEDRQAVFVTPTLRGWVLVIGRRLWSKADLNMPVQKIAWFKDIAKLYDHAYFFSTMRGLENHGWLKIENSNITRAYGYCGELEEIMWSMGKVTPEEISLDANFAVPYTDGGGQVIPKEKDVLEIAAKWTVDTSFADYNYDLDLGFVGKLL